MGSSAMIVPRPPQCVSVPDGLEARSRDGSRFPSAPPDCGTVCESRCTPTRFVDHPVYTPFQTTCATIDSIIGPGPIPHSCLPYLCHYSMISSFTLQELSSASGPPQTSWIYCQLVIALAQGMKFSTDGLSIRRETNGLYRCRRRRHPGICRLSGEECVQ